MRRLRQQIATACAVYASKVLTHARHTLANFFFFFFFFFFLKVWWQAATLFIYFTLREHTYNIYICNSLRTASSCLYRFRSVEGLLWGAEPRFKLRPALQQADALRFAPRRTTRTPTLANCYRMRRLR